MRKIPRVVCPDTAAAAADMTAEQVEAALESLFAEVRAKEAEVEAAKRKIRALKDARAAKDLQARARRALERVGISPDLYATAGLAEAGSATDGAEGG